MVMQRLERDLICYCGLMARREGRHGKPSLIAATWLCVGDEGEACCLTEQIAVPMWLSS